MFLNKNTHQLSCFIAQASITQGKIKATFIMKVMSKVVTGI